MPFSYSLGVGETVAKLKAYGANWAQQAAPYFTQALGLSPTFAVKAALLYVVLHLLGLAPRITSGFRDPAKQQAMRDAWDRGDRQGLRVRPAAPEGSRHSRTSMTGSPASTAIDMPCSDDRRAAEVAKLLGLRPGLYFNPPDPGHYDEG